MRGSCHRTIAVFLIFLTIPTLAFSATLQFVPKWTRFEQSFKSDQIYSHPLQSCTLSVEFVSPFGETNRVYGFWDGGKTWRVRFSPNLAGRWTYRTRCSDFSNTGLQDQTGAFLCTAPIAVTKFNQHGPIRAARDLRHFEHEDGTPFFWLADSVWDGARRSSSKDWTTYAQIRAYQTFTAAQWTVEPGKDSEDQMAFLGRTQISPNLEFFQRLDEKIGILNRSGLLNVIAPFWKSDPSMVESFPEDQLVLLLRYYLARWGADDVAWLLAANGSTDREIQLWKRVGRAVFSESSHALVILFPGETTSALNDLAAEQWVNGFGYRNGANSNSNDQFARLKVPIVSPYENSLIDGSDQRIDSGEIRRSFWESLLSVSPAGAIYGTPAVTEWNQSLQKTANDLPLWQKSLFLPGAKQASVVSIVFNSIPFEKLRSSPASLVDIAGNENTGRFIAAAQTDDKNLSIFYVSGERTLELALNALPPLPILSWINPATGESSTAVAVVGPRSIKLPTPDGGDWVLVAKAKK